MEFSWTDRQLELRESALRFAKESLDGGMIERDRDALFSRERWKACADFGIQGLPFPPEYGGRGEDALTTVLAMEALGQGCDDNGLLFGINAQMWSVQTPIFRHGSDAQRERYLSRLCRGEWIGAHAMSEPTSGSDAFAMHTTARREGDDYILNGKKIFISNAPVADMFVVFATIDRRLGPMGVTGFIVERGFPGITVSDPVSKMGLRTTPMGELTLEECRVPAENRLGKEGRGAGIFNDSMEWERSCILSGCVGAMQRQLDACLQRAREREQFGQPIAKFQAIAHKLTAMRVRLETSRLMLYHAAWLKQTGQNAAAAASMAKLSISEAWIQSCHDAVQIHGGYGYLTAYEVERDLRDAVASTLFSGTSEIQKAIIGRAMGI